MTKHLNKVSSYLKTGSHRWPSY